MYALQDEPEKGRRLAVLGVGAILAAVLQGGGLYAAHSFEPPDDGVRKASLVQINIVEPPPPPPPPPEPPPPPPEPEPKPEPELKPEPPKPEPKPKPKPKPKPQPKPEPKPEPPKPKPKKPVPLQTGLTLGSTVKGGKGPAFQVGNTAMGEVGRTARDAVTEAATPAEPAPEKPPAKPPAPPKRTKAKRVKNLKPAYPVAAERAGAEGTVILIVTIDENGDVVEVKVIKDPGYGFGAAAERAARRWKYEPATFGGKPVRSSKRETVDFILTDD